MKYIMCVPNFSEGINEDVINAIRDSIQKSAGVESLGVEPGASTNRTVYTFCGSPTDVVQGALNAAITANSLIDMSKHKGEHPRMGAMDVCPFVPVGTATMDDCIECANQFAKELATALNVPAYLYGFASKSSYRTTVPQIREGEYEALPEKITKEAWKPDYGPATFVPKWGATLVGARNFLIAYNVNLLGTKEQANTIAFNIRERGRGPEQPGRLKNVQAIGWRLEELNLAQVSINLTDLTVTPLHVAFEECVKDAKSMKLSVAGSEIVGLVPLQSIMEAADFYIQREDLFILEEENKIRLVVDRLGLSSISYFDPNEKIVELAIRKISSSTGPLVGSSVSEFVKKVRSRTSAPGGGSVSALVASLGSGLTSMYSLLSYGNKKFAHLDSDIRRLLPRMYKTTEQFLPLIDEDAQSFVEYMEACRLPKKTDAEKEIRSQAMEKGICKAISFPLKLIKMINTLWSDLTELCEIGNINCMSDLQVGVRCLETAAYGAYYNVKINLKDVQNKENHSHFSLEVEKELKLAVDNAQSILQKLSQENFE